MKDNTVLVNGHYQILISPKTLDVNFPNNWKQTEKRSDGPEKRFKRDHRSFQQYKEFMEDLIDNGCIQKCKSEAKEGRCCYLPVHGVCFSQRPEKIKVLFDFSAQY